MPLVRHIVVASKKIMRLDQFMDCSGSTDTSLDYYSYLETCSSHPPRSPFSVFFGTVHAPSIFNGIPATRI